MCDHLIPDPGLVTKFGKWLPSLVTGFRHAVFGSAVEPLGPTRSTHRTQASGTVRVHVQTTVAIAQPTPARGASTTSAFVPPMEWCPNKRVKQPPPPKCRRCLFNQDEPLSSASNIDEPR